MTHDGLALWTATEQVGAGATVQHSGGAITGFDVYCPGTNYAAAPTVTIVDLHSAGNSPGDGDGRHSSDRGTCHRHHGYVGRNRLPAARGAISRNRACREPWICWDWMWMYWAEPVIFAVGYSNTTAAGTTSKPMIWAYDDQGCLLWVKEPHLTDEFTAVQVSRTNIYAVGMTSPG